MSLSKEELFFKDFNDNILLLERKSNNCFLIINKFSPTFSDYLIVSKFKEYESDFEISLKFKINDFNDDECIVNINPEDIQHKDDEQIVISFYNHLIYFNKFEHIYPDLIDELNKTVKETSSSIKEAKKIISSSNSKTKTKTKNNAPKR